MAQNEMDPDARLFFEGIVRDCLDTPAAVRRLLDLEPPSTTLSPAARDLAARLFRDEPDAFSQVLVEAALRVGWGVAAHLAGATWISNDGRPVALVPSTDLCGDVSDDYMMDFAMVLDELRPHSSAGDPERVE